MVGSGLLGFGEPHRFLMNLCTKLLLGKLLREPETLMPPAHGATLASV